MRKLETKTKIKNIFFDFDGVIAESVSAKTEAFREMYLQHGDYIANRVVTYHISHGGVSRYEKFRHWEKAFFNKDINDAEVQILAQDFSDRVMQKVIESEEVTGAYNFIKKYNKALKFWVITGTPTTEIKIIANKRGLKDFFIGFHGSPENKVYWTEYLIKKFKLNRSETLFLGDATTDRDAAKFSKLHFGWRENDENKLLFSQYKGLRFKDFIELERIIKHNIS